VSREPQLRTGTQRIHLERRLKKIAASARNTGQILTTLWPGAELIKAGLDYDEYIDLLLTLDNIVNSVDITPEDL
jgi:hypothetical protein